MEPAPKETAEVKTLKWSAEELDVLRRTLAAVCRAMSSASCERMMCSDPLADETVGEMLMLLPLEKHADATAYCRTFIDLSKKRATKVTRSAEFWKLLRTLFTREQCALLYFQGLELRNNGHFEDALKHVSKALNISMERCRQLHKLAADPAGYQAELVTAVEKYHRKKG